MTETTERFLQEIATRVGYDRVAELYLFPVLRQGGVEGAVAVVAAYPEPVAAAEPEVTPVDDARLDSGDEIVVEGQSPREVVGDAADDAAAPEVDVTESLGTDGVADGVAEDVADASEPSEEEETGASNETSERVAHETSSPPHRPERTRHVVYTALYRHTIKGTDRGRWLVEVVAEADAPLITVEEVVRGVVRRSGDAFQPERISGDQFRALVPAPAAPGSAPA